MRKRTSARTLTGKRLWRSPEIHLQGRFGAARRDVPEGLAMVGIVGATALEQVVDLLQAEACLACRRRAQRLAVREDAHASHDRIPGEGRVALAEYLFTHRGGDALAGHP